MDRLIDISLLDEALILDPETGLLTWSDRPISHFMSDAARRTWRGRCLGKPAFNTEGPSGYLIGTIFGKQIYTHRVVYAIHNRKWPEQFLDHINGVVTDNRPVNLRECSTSENGENRKIGVNNTSGFMGVTYVKRTGLWQASIRTKGRTKFIGHFETAAQAGEAYAQVKKMMHKFNPVVRCAEKGVDIWGME